MKRTNYNKPIRVLHVVGNMNTGGLETLIMNWYRSIDRTKIQFDFLTHYKEKGFYDEEIEALGGKVYHTSLLDDKNFIEYSKFLRSFFTAHREYRIVHGHHAAIGAIYLREAFKSGIPTRISHAHIADYSKTIRGFLTHLASRRYGTYANVHFACSNKAGNYMYGAKDSYTVIKNGIDTEKFKFNPDIRRKIRDDFNLNEQLVIVHVGRFHDQKNHSFLIDIFNELKKRVKKTKLIMIGDGPLRLEIEKK